jgi:hypothetical protein
VAKVPRLRLEIVKRSDRMKGFVVLPRCSGGRTHLFLVERRRQFAKDFENLAGALATFVTLASIHLALRRLASAAVCGSQASCFPTAVCSVRGSAAKGERLLSVRSADLRRDARQWARCADSRRSPVMGRTSQADPKLPFVTAPADGGAVMKRTFALDFYTC